MVMRLFRLWRDTSGVSLTEGLITFPIVFFAITSFVEGGLAVYQYNQVTKAVAVGARLAAVSDPVVTNGKLVITDPRVALLKPGDQLPDGIAPIECVAGTSTGCDKARFDRIFAGTTNSGTDACNAAKEAGVMGICDVAPRVAANNVKISYMFTGLGYVGRPYNPVVTVKVEVSGVTFDFFLLGAAYNWITGQTGLGRLTIPTQSVTITSEDLSTTPLGVTTSGG